MLNQRDIEIPRDALLGWRHSALDTLAEALPAAVDVSLVDCSVFIRGRQNSIPVH
ncbi:MAG: hypothetical protein V5B32_06920 [Candidatus Accumulibacter sp. UW26]|jgi:hypothetical protein